MRIALGSILAAWLVLLAPSAAAQEATPTDVAGAGAADPTVAALEKEKLAEEVEQLRRESGRGPRLGVFWNWLWNNGTAVAALVVGLVGIGRWFADRGAEREKRAEERFQSVVQGLGSDSIATQVGAAVTHRTFLQTSHGQFVVQVFNLAVAHLRLQPDPDIQGDGALVTQSPLAQALTAVFATSYPRARERLIALDVGPPPVGQLAGFHVIREQRIRALASKDRPDGQERRCREYVAAQDWTLQERHVFREAWSGAYLGRARLEDLRDAIKRRELDRVVVYHSDRWGRDPEHRIFLQVEASIHGCKYVSVEHGCKYVSVEDDRPDTDEGRLLQYISGWSAGNEHRNIGRRGQAALRDRVASGRRLVGAKPPYGYRWSSEVDAKGKPVRGGLVVYEPEAVIVRRIFRELAAGASLRGVAEGLNRDRVPTPNPARVKPGNVPTWYIRTVHLLLDNPVYVGRSVAYRQVAELRDEYTGRRVPRVKPESEWVEVPGSTVPALVDQATWEAAQTRRAVNRERSRRSKTEHTDALLSLGVARCAYCDAALHVNRTKGGRVRYRCGHQQPKPGCRAAGRAFGSCVEAHLLDRVVWAAVEAVLSNRPSSALGSATRPATTPPPATLPPATRTWPNSPPRKPTSPTPSPRSPARPRSRPW